MPRFAILEHDHPFLHWDFMLEVEDSLRTWRLLQEPLLNDAEKQIRCVAEPLADHRIAYLDYEGPVSRDRGTVRCWDAGLYLLLGQSEKHWEFRLEGNRLSGFASIVRKKETWEFLLIPDETED